MQAKAGLGIGLSVAEGGGNSARVFGFPGTGKSDFPLDLTYRMNNEFEIGYSMVRVVCDKAALAAAMGRAESVIKRLKRVTKEASRNLPTLVVFDELEALAAPILEVEARIAQMTRWIRDYTDVCRPKTFYMGITNYPNRIEPSVFRRFGGSTLYFDPTSVAVIGKIIGTSLGMVDCQKFAKLLCENLDRDDLTIMGSSVIYACNELKKTYKNLRKFSREWIKRALISLAGCTPKGLVRDYEDTYKGLIKLAKNHQMPWWARIFETRTK